MISGDVTTQRKRFDENDDDVINRFDFDSDDVINQNRINDVTPHQQRLSDMSDKKIVNKRVLFGLMMDHNNQVSINKLDQGFPNFFVIDPKNCF